MKHRNNTPQSVNFVDMEEAGNFFIPEAGRQIIKSAESWQQLWEKYWNQYSGEGQKTAPPDVDFNRKMVVVLTWGQGYSGCANHVKTVEQVERTGDTLKIIIGPLPSLGPCDMKVAPVQMIRIPRMEIPIVFEGDVPGAN
ncbi:MAG: hypothetical protein ACE5GL_04295 [Calditrichia bacterium]